MKMSPAICNLSCRRIRIIMKLWFHNLLKISFLFKVNYTKLHNFIFSALICNCQAKMVWAWRNIKEFELFFIVIFLQKKKKSILVVVFGSQKNHDNSQLPKMKSGMVLDMFDSRESQVCLLSRQHQKGKSVGLLQDKGFFKHIPPNTFSTVSQI